MDSRKIAYVLCGIQAALAIFSIVLALCCFPANIQEPVREQEAALTFDASEQEVALMPIVKKKPLAKWTFDEVSEPEKDSVDNALLEGFAESEATGKIEAPIRLPEPKPISISIDANELEIFAKLLYCEAGSMGWEGQVHVASAILNLSDYTGRSIWNMAHDVKCMQVAPWVDAAIPMPMQYEVIEYVLNGGRVPDIVFFRTDYYHPFGKPVVQVENVFFSKP